MHLQKNATKVVIYGKKKEGKEGFKKEGKEVTPPRIVLRSSKHPHSMWGCFAFWAATFQGLAVVLSIPTYGAIREIVFF